MSFVPNSLNEQLSLFDSFTGLTAREKKFLDRSWAKYFSEYIFPKIDEKPYAVLYSEKDSRPNTPVNIQVGALLLKELTGMSDDETVLALMFDVRFQYALHTTSYREQPLNDRTLGRFRARLLAYEKETGIDLIHNTIQKLSAEMAQIMKIDQSLKRMDSMMVASNIKRMGRLELLYTCVSNLAKEAKKAGMELPENLLHYTEDDDRNRVIYHNRSEETQNKILTVLGDAATLKELCATDYAESVNYGLLVRVLDEQAVFNGDGSYRLRTKEDGGMDASILQNPADPDATYREKAGKQNRGYAANLTEACGGEGSIVTDYQYDTNTHSDAAFIKEAIESAPDQEEKTVIVADGAYCGKEIQKAAEEKKIEVVNTNLTGRQAQDILADFHFSEDGKRVTECPAGKTPKSCSYNASTGQCQVSFPKSECAGCPLKDKCHPKMYKRVAKKSISKNGRERAIQQRTRNSESFIKRSRFRNGVETLPSILRRKYRVDQMPVRGLLATKLYYGFKIGALNISKFCQCMRKREKCAQNAVIA